MQPDDAVLLLAHGTPNVLGEMAEYLGKVTGGRAAAPGGGAGVAAPLWRDWPRKRRPATKPPPLTKWTLKQGFAAGTGAELFRPQHEGLRRHAQLASVHCGCRRADACRWRAALQGHLPGAAELAHQRGPLPQGGHRRGAGACRWSSLRDGRRALRLRAPLPTAYGRHLGRRPARHRTRQRDARPLYRTLRSMQDDHDRGGIGCRSPAGNARAGLARSVSRSRRSSTATMVAELSETASA